MWIGLVAPGHPAFATTEPRPEGISASPEFGIITVVFLAPMAALFAGLIVSGWVQFRIGHELEKNVRKWFACLLGLLTPFSVFLAMECTMMFVEMVGDWICLLALLLPLFCFGELIAKFSHEQTIIA